MPDPVSGIEIGRPESEQKGVREATRTKWGTAGALTSPAIATPLVGGRLPQNERGPWTVVH